MEFEPPARRFHTALAMGQNMVVWAGDGGFSSFESSVVNRFNVASTSWQQPRRLFNQALPDSYSHMAVASDAENAYMFAGYSGLSESKQLCNKLYHVNMMSLECCELVPTTSVSPTARSSSGLVCVNRTLVSYGGYTGPAMASNELFLFDLNTSKRVLYFPMHVGTM